MKEGRMEGRGGWKRTARMGQEERGEEGRLTESGTPHHRWWDARHPFVRSSVVAVVRAHCALIAVDGVVVVVWALVALVVWARVSVNGMVMGAGIGIWPWSLFVVRAWFFV